MLPQIYIFILYIQQSTCVFFADLADFDILDIAKLRRVSLAGSNI